MRKDLFAALGLRQTFFPVIAAGLAASGSASAYEIAATIAPLSGIAAAITDGTTIQVDTLLPPGVAPESAEPGASTTSTAARANMVLLGDPEYDTFLGDIAKERPDTVVSMSSFAEGPLMTKRSNHYYEMTPFGITVDPKDFADAHAKDYHLWLNPDYALAMAKSIHDRLVAALPDDAATFDANYANFARGIDAVKQNAQQNFYRVQGQAYIAYQDDFQYLDQAFNLHQTAIIKNAAVSKAAPDAAGDTPALAKDQEQELKERIASQQVRCLVYDTPEGVAPTKELAKETGAVAVGINPFGDRDATPSATSYLTFLNGVTTQFARCLNGG